VHILIAVIILSHSAPAQSGVHLQIRTLLSHRKAGFAGIALIPFRCMRDRGCEISQCDNQGYGKACD
jgi:hypothetical protein